jgi:hypothetical protein
MEKGVVEQAHEIQCMVKELELLKIVVPSEFVARGIIAKLPRPWRDFTTILKHKRIHVYISDLIVSLVIEEKRSCQGWRIKELRVKPVPTWCTIHSHMARGKASKTRIITSQSKILPSRRRIRRRGEGKDGNR